MQPHRYLETQILGATGLELVQMLCQGALNAVEAAHTNLNNGDIPARAKSVSRALDFISELALSLNHEAGGTISRNLAELYAYIQRLIAEAHAEKSGRKFEEAGQLLNTMLDMWRQVDEKQRGAEAPAASAWALGGAEAGAGGGRSWQV